MEFLVPSQASDLSPAADFFSPGYLNIFKIRVYSDISVPVLKNNKVTVPPHVPDMPDGTGGRGINRCTGPAFNYQADCLYTVGTVTVIPCHSSEGPTECRIPFAFGFSRISLRIVADAPYRGFFIISRGYFEGLATLYSAPR